jgi:hypothetical protein
MRGDPDPVLQEETEVTEIGGLIVAVKLRNVWLHFLLLPPGAYRLG